MSIAAAVLTERVAAIGLPIAKNAFEGTLEDPVPDLPYLVYLTPHRSGRGADYLNNLVAEDWQLELYTVADDEAAEELREKIRNEVLPDVEYEEYTTPIEEEGCFQTAFEVTAILRKK
jgi:hypothetical protein